MHVGSVGFARFLWKLSPLPVACRQHATGKRGLYRTLLVEQRPMSLAKDFRPQAVEDESLPPAKETPEEVERRFWRNVNLRPPLYGADVPGSLFDEDLKVQSPQCRVV